MDLVPLEPFGVEVRDLDLSKLLGDREAASLRAALDEGLLLLFRNQHISDEDHLRVVEGMIPGLVATPDDRRLAQPVTFLSNTGHTDLKDSILAIVRRCHDDIHSQAGDHRVAPRTATPRREAYRRCAA